MNGTMLWRIFGLFLCCMLLPTRDFMYGKDQKNNEPQIPDNIMYILINSFLNAGNEPQNLEAKEENSDEKEKPAEVKTFKDVLGQDAVLKEVQEIVDFMKNPEKYKKFGAEIPKGLLLQGPPGTGKTLIAKAIAGEANCQFFYASASEFVDRFVGMGAHNIRELFTKARKAPSAVIFIDEIDAVATSREKQIESNQEYRQTLNELLNQLDGFKTDENIIVIGATNMVKSLDPALLRPGRFTRVVEVPLPTRKGREDILAYYLKKLSHLDENVSAAKLADETLGWSGADLKNLVNEAAILAARENASLITQKYFDLAWDKISIGLVSDIERSPEQRKKTAYHEAGHTLLKVLNGLPISKVTILPRGRTLGVTKGRAKYETISDYNRDELFKYIMMSQAGFIAEKIIFQQTHPGVCNDLERANAYARAMVYEYGMGSSLEGIAGAGFNSEKMRMRCDQEVLEILQRALAQTEKLLIAHKDKLHALAEALLKEETLVEHQVYAITGINKDVLAEG